MRQILMILICSISGTLFSQNNTFPSSGNVGIGISTPGSKLDIRNSSVSVVQDIRSTYSTDHWLSRVTTNQTNWSGFWETSDDIRLLLRDNNGNVDIDLRPDSVSYINGGNLGIGTSNPGVKLEVFSSAPVIRLKNSAEGTSSYGWLEFYDSNSRMGYLGFGSSNNNNLYLSNETGGNIVLPNGNIGIGTSSPTHKLHVEGTINGTLRHKSHYFTLFPYNSSYDDGSYAKTFYDGNRKQIRFWNSDGGTNFTRLETGGLSIGSPNPISSTNGFENKIEFINGGHGAIVFHPGQSDELMFGMHQNGNFYWGRGRSHAQNPSDYSMFLNGINGNLGIRGKLTANEVKVKSGGWADYVFVTDYDLPTLEEVEKHIKEKGHLINIPSAKEVEENGVQLGEMNKLLLEKIEELTLYTIEQEKKIKEAQKLKLELQTLNDAYGLLLKRIEQLENE